MIDSYNGFLAEVRNINDPFKSGRVQIRIYGDHDDQTNIKDADLPWAIVSQPITSAATSKIGIIPTGMIVGSRVYGIFLDRAQQYPMVLGTFSRGSKLFSDSNNDGGQEILDPNQKGVDTPASGHPEDYNNRGTTPNSTLVGGSAVDPTGSSYNEAPYVLNGTGPQGLSTARNTFAPNSNESTVAAVNPSTDLPSAIQQVGTSGTVLPSMISLLSAVRSIMTMSNQNTSSSQNNTTGTNTYVTEALTNVLCQLSNNYGFFYSISLLSNTFLNGRINSISSSYQNIVINSVINFIQIGIKNNFVNLPYTQIPSANLLPQNTIVPSPLVSVVPNYYIQQYYSASDDPYAGYVQWLGPTGNYVYTVRTSAQPNYTSSEQSIVGTAQIEFLFYLNPCFAANSLTISNLNNILSNVVPQTVSVAQNNSLGTNSSSNILSLALLLLGSIGSMINQSTSIHLPNSVLNQSSMTSTLNKFAQNISYLKQMKNASISAFALPTAITNLSSLLTSITGGVQISLGQNGGISGASIVALLNLGIPQTAITSLNNLAINNSNLTAANLSTIALITSALNSSNVPVNDIIAIQTLLAEIV